jgi:hypothetical protein
MGGSVGVAPPSIGYIRGPAIRWTVSSPTTHTPPLTPGLWPSGGV